MILDSVILKDVKRQIRIPKRNFRWLRFSGAKNCRLLQNNYFFYSSIQRYSFRVSKFFSPSKLISSRSFRIFLVTRWLFIFISVLNLQWHHINCLNWVCKIPQLLALTAPLNKNVQTFGWFCRVVSQHTAQALQSDLISIENQTWRLLYLDIRSPNWFNLSS
jgi:hypothetical protein